MHKGTSQPGELGQVSAGTWVVRPWWSLTPCPRMRPAVPVPSPRCPQRTSPSKREPQVEDIHGTQATSVLGPRSATALAGPGRDEDTGMVHTRDAKCRPGLRRQQPQVPMGGWQGPSCWACHSPLQPTPETCFPNTAWRRLAEECHTGPQKPREAACGCPPINCRDTHSKREPSASGLPASHPPWVSWLTELI